MKTQIARGESDTLLFHADPVIVEAEVIRLPDVLHARLTFDATGRIGAAHVVARRDSALLRIARDVRSVIELAAGVELPLDRVVVLEEGFLDLQRAERDERAEPHVERTGTPVERTGAQVERTGTPVERTGAQVERTGAQVERDEPHVERTGTQVETVIDLRDAAPLDAAPLDAAAWRLLERALQEQQAGAEAEVPAPLPAWGELLVPSTGAEHGAGRSRGDAPGAGDSRPGEPRTHEELDGDGQGRGQGQGPQGDEHAQRWAGPDIFVGPPSPGGLLGRSLRLFGVNR